jgi:hypothetical protein
MSNETSQITSLEPGNRVQLPIEWANALGMQGMVKLDKTDDGILVRPCAQSSWEKFFANKLTVGSAPLVQDENELEITGDDLVF